MTESASKAFGERDFYEAEKYEMIKAKDGEYIVSASTLPLDALPRNPRTEDTEERQEEDAEEDEEEEDKSYYSPNPTTPHPPTSLYPP